MDKKLMNRSVQSPKGAVETKKNQGTLTKCRNHSVTLRQMISLIPSPHPLLTEYCSIENFPVSFSDVTVAKSFPKQSRKREKPGQKVEYLPKKQTNACQKSKHHGRKPGPKPYLDIGAKNAEVIYKFLSSYISSQLPLSYLVRESNLLFSKFLIIGLIVMRSQSVWTTTQILVEARNKILLIC